MRSIDWLACRSFSSFDFFIFMIPNSLGGKRFCYF